MVAGRKVPEIDGDRLPAAFVVAAPVPDNIVVAVEADELAVDADQHIGILVTVELFVRVELIGEGDLGVRRIRGDVETVAEAAGHAVGDVVAVDATEQNTNPAVRAFAGRVYTFGIRAIVCVVEGPIGIGEAARAVVEGFRQECRGLCLARLGAADQRVVADAAEQRVFAQAAI